ncbi:HP0495 family protein [Hahella ganghwensis]|uniref:HP0495 family protein n=1 Tax=Hahella ganghwensis TaxID=286420 RepID=UPI000362AD4C|nr:DUF493 domain-containing protein [Hahella ganghwensis]
MSETPKIEFPCDYPLKVIGHAEPDFKEVVVEIVKEHYPAFTESSVEVIDSRNGRFASLRFSIVAESEDHVKTLFVALKAHKYVQMVL